MGVSFNKADEIYCGEKAFSEKESLAISKLIRSYSKNLEYYLAFHSYGQYMIIPYAHSQRHEENYDEVASITLFSTYKTEFFEMSVILPTTTTASTLLNSCPIKYLF